MELYQLRTFVAVAETGNLTRAAERVHTSVPAASAQVKALEDELGVRLFERSPRGMALTAAGERLLADARRTLDAARRLHATAARLRAAPAGVVRMGTVSDPLALRLGEVFVKLAERHPELVLRLEQQVSLRALHAVRRGELDCACVLSTQTTFEGLELRRLMPLSIVVALPRHADAPAGIDELLRRPWIAAPPDCGLRRCQEQLFEAHGGRPPSGPVADHEGAVRALVAAGVGVGMMRLDLAREAEARGELRIWPGWSADTWLCWAAAEPVAADSPVGVVRGLVLEGWA